MSSINPGIKAAYVTNHALHIADVGVPGIADLKVINNPAALATVANGQVLFYSAPVKKIRAVYESTGAATGVEMYLSYGFANETDAQAMLASDSTRRIEKVDHTNPIDLEFPEGGPLSVAVAVKADETAGRIKLEIVR